MEVTPADVLDLTGETVTEASIKLAIASLYVEVGFDLTDAEVIAKLKPADVGHLRAAVIWQAVYLAKNPDINRDRAIASVSVPGVSVSYRADQDFPLSPLAIRALAWLTWRNNTGNVTITPVGMRPANDPRYRPEPDPWRPIGRY